MKKFLLYPQELDDRISILCVDDEPSYLSLMELYLEKINDSFKVIRSNSVQDALKIMKSENIDVIVADYRMPVDNGLDFLKILRNNKNFIPFIILTGKGDEDIVIKALNLGANRYIQKSSDQKAMFNILSQVIINEVEYKRAQDALKENETFFRILAEQSLLGIFILQDHLIKYINQAAADIFGYSIEEIIVWKPKEAYIKTIHPDDVDFIIEQATKKATGQEGVIDHYETRVMTKRGDIKWVEIYSKSITFNGKIAEFVTFKDVSDREEAEKALMESEDRFRSIIEYSHEAIVITDENYLFSYVNNEACNLFGYSQEEIIGLDFRRTLSNESMDLVIERNRARLRGDDVPSQYEFYIQKKDGEKRLVEVSSVVIQDFGGRQYTVGQMLDITERRRNEDALRESEEKYRMLVEQLQEGVILSNIEGYMSFVNPKFCSMLGYSKKELINNHWKNIVPPEEYEKINAERVKRLRGEVNEYETVLLAKDGSHIPVIVNGTPVYSTEKEIIGTLVVFNDITERKKAEEAMLASEEKYRMLVETSPELIFKQNRRSKFTFVNKTFLESLGYEMDECMDMVGPDLVHSEDVALVQKSAIKIFAGQDVNDIQCRFKKKNGEYIWISANATPVFNIEGDVIEVLAIAQDITERKKAEDRQRRAERALEESEARYRSIITSMTDGVVVTDLKNQIMLVNKAFKLMLGYSKKELIGRSVEDFIYIDSLETFRKKTHERISGLILSDEYELTFIKKSGEKMIARIGASAFVREDTIEGSFAVVTDITAQQELEQRRSNFISMTTHELRTPLTVIKGYVDLFEKFIQKSTVEEIERYQRPLQQVNKNIDRLEKLISDVNNIGRIEAGVFQLEIEQMDFYDLLSEIVSSYKMILKEQLESNIDPNHPPILIFGDSARLFQAFCNLIENAIQNTPEDKRKILINLYSRTNSANIEIIDNGAGIEPQLLKIIFEPFVSIPTEYHVKGTGVGLYLAKFIVEAHGGTLNVASEGKGKGSIFSIMIPLKTLE